MVIPKRLLEKLSLSLLAGLAAAVGVLIFLAWLTDEVLEGDTSTFDEATRNTVHQFASPTLTTLMRGISFLGSTRFLFSATVVIALLLFFRAWRRASVLLAVTMIGGAVLNMTLKLAFKRARPEPFFDLATPRSFSFPSGHSLASFCFFGALALMINARIENRNWRLPIWIGAGVMVFLIGLSRIYLGVHHATDVIAGFMAALIWVGAVKFVDDQLLKRRRRRQGHAETG
jgi:undecaprenyl-diphosphatase